MTAGPPTYQPTGEKLPCDADCYRLADDPGGMAIWGVVLLAIVIGIAWILSRRLRRR